ncbi:hypothetical protein INT43_007312 [Umbelopsis isabellina]|uniref:Uncharacterized protein n=1 Tax=Mortierella isabellina TaxID=91625 RepID=A0A8H7PXW0_MORIS|nr:hypothetical protein INT43_007312 [Umbelopsis isabellina]
MQHDCINGSPPHVPGRLWMSTYIRAVSNHTPSNINHHDVTLITGWLDYSLVFLGSEKYPFKGVLDSLANRALAQGTNAWTDVDHTCYTITTAGSEGFLNILPVYIDHILYPTLTSSGCYTEVHHINGKGEDAG